MDEDVSAIEYVEKAMRKNFIEQFIHFLHTPCSIDSFHDGVCHRIARLNSSEGDLDDHQRFSLAIDLAGAEFLQCVDYLINYRWAMRQVVMNAIEQAEEVTGRQDVIVLEVAGPWKEHLSNLEKERADIMQREIALCITAHTSTPRQIRWMVHVVSHSYELKQHYRVRIPKDLKDTVQGCIFVHYDGQLAEFTTKEGAIEV